jgi:methyl coenzyme M reductase alpha subunit
MFIIKSGFRKSAVGGLSKTACGVSRAFGAGNTATTTSGFILRIAVIKSSASRCFLFYVSIYSLSGN